jgi:citrate synthase
VVDSALTMLDPAGHLYYRGVDVVGLCSSASFEHVAELLWTGSRDEPQGWTAPREAIAVGAAVQGSLPAAAALVDRIRATAAAIGPADPLRYDRHPAAVARCAGGLVTALVESLPLHSRGRRAGRTAGGEGAGASVAARLWPRLSPLAPRPADLAALNGALVLLADHELAASTLAARVAASTWADPYLVVLAGLGALGGPLHGGASNEVARLLADARRAGVPAAVGEVLRTAGAVPGFGHRVYVGADPRADALIGLVAAARPECTALSTAGELVEVMSGREGGFANVDLALAVLADAGAMAPGAGEAIFAVARTAGFVAHAIEEYGHRLRFRPRAAYVGPLPAHGPRRRRRPT